MAIKVKGNRRKVVKAETVRVATTQERGTEMAVTPVLVVAIGVGSLNPTDIILNHRPVLQGNDWRAGDH
jgi:hypothetical protein